MDLPQLDDYRSLFLNNTPLLDVRAPVEFLKGAFPHSKNIPLMNDHERTAIGIHYKKFGQDEAIKLGQQLIQGEVKSVRVDRWAEFVKQNPQGVLYCFRGGMRSKISQQWIYENTGILYPRIKGGYKALRRFLINQLDESPQYLTPIILSGQTGAGKTLFLKKLKQQMDLEGIYHHRGSVFGKHVTPQPSQIDIENTLAIKLLKYIHRGNTKILLEDEGNNIGSRNLPKNLFEKMKQSPVVQLEVSIKERIDITFQEYIIESLDEHQTFYGEEQGLILWIKQLQDSIDKIKKRLGGVLHKKMVALLTNAIKQQRAGNIATYKDLISVLLLEYYDPMYDYQLGKKRDRLVFKGNHDEVLSYLTTEYQFR